MGYLTNGSRYDLGKTNYTSVAGALGDNVTTNSSVDGPGINLQMYVGLFTNRSKRMLTEVSANDGASNTLMFGETYANTNPPAAAKWGGPFTYSWMAGPLMTAYGLPSNPNPSTDPPGWNYFSSRHNGIVLFAYGDGSVRGLRVGATGVRNPLPAGTVLPNGRPDAVAQQTEWCILQALGGKGDGFQADSSKIGN